MAALTPKDFRVGQELVFLETGGQVAWAFQPADVTVTKVGRVWVHASNGYQFSPDDMLAKGNGSGYQNPGRFFLSAADHRKFIDLAGAWSNFCQRVGKMWCKKPDHIQLSDIEAMSAVVDGRECHLRAVVAQRNLALERLAIRDQQYAEINAKLAEVEEENIKLAQLVANLRSRFSDGIKGVA